ncbi:MAG: FtsX-like permease family protein, partial [Verrucomicrobiota bacterium]
AGYRAFLIDTPAGAETAVAAEWTRALQDRGFEAIDTRDRLARFHAVQNTYLNTFQSLGGLGLLLGSVGLGVVVLRNVFERRAELAVLQAVGFPAGLLRRWVLLEHALLLVAGLLLGLLAALPPLVPVLGAPGAGFPVGSLALTLVLVLANGLAWAAWATRRACAGSLLAALRGE